MKRPYCSIMKFIPKRVSRSSSESNNRGVIIKAYYLFFRALSSTLVKINVGLLEDNVGITSTNSLDGSHCEHDFSITIDVRAHDTKNVLELLWNNESLKKELNKKHEHHS